MSLDDFRGCGFGLGPALSFADLIKRINTVDTNKIPYSKYFEIFSFEFWSLEHYIIWVIDKHEFTDKDQALHIFYESLQRIVNDENASIRNKESARILLKNKMSDPAKVAHIWASNSQISEVRKAIKVVEAHMELDNITNQRVEKLNAQKLISEEAIFASRETRETRETNFTSRETNPPPKETNLPSKEKRSNIHHEVNESSNSIKKIKTTGSNIVDIDQIQILNVERYVKDQISNAERFARDQISDAERSAREHILDLENLSKDQILEVECLGTSSVFKTIAVDGIKKEPILPHGRANLLSVRRNAGMLFVDKSEYIEKLEKLDSKFRVMLLRPRRFGKSFFLDMLCLYYDIQTAAFFDQLFGPLYIGKHPTRSHNTHLVLRFDLSTIAEDSQEGMRLVFNDVINTTLRDFIMKYTVELGYPNSHNLIVKKATTSLLSVFNLVQSRGFDLFVGIDEYDTPGNTTAFRMDVNKERNIGKIEQFFNVALFSMLKKGCQDVIDKLYVTGISPGFSASLDIILEDISSNSDFHGICGFTDDEVKTISLCYFNNNEQIMNDVLDQINRLYKGYRFLNTDEDMIAPLYNSQLIFHYLIEKKGQEFVALHSESVFLNFSRVLKTIIEQSPVSINDVIDLLIHGSVPTSVISNFNYSDVFKIEGEEPSIKQKQLTWSILYYFGMLTRRVSGELVIPNEIIRTEIITRVSDHISTKKDIGSQIFPACVSLMQGNANYFVDLIKGFFMTRSMSSVCTMNESALQTAIEILLPSALRIPEVCLVIDDGTNQKGQYCFVDVFIPEGVNIENPLSTVALKLKYITLMGLLSGTKKQWITTPEPKIMEWLDKEIEKENLEQLLNRDYMYWSIEKRGYVINKVGDFLNYGQLELDRYNHAIANGKVRDCLDAGVLDSRIGTKRFPSQLRTYLIMTLGSRRVMVWPSEPVAIDWKYYINN
ncbi:1657_t:CDS:2 [Diversispora eburnea]|uniref:1657_t:CDS:1 n=1 Tax=Diversispora eburnea TaxID=1213867 RepID=A0A9N8W7F2_9GLOM|nr:1657_t:CDS:2 [Diversispora eburnea]